MNIERAGKYTTGMEEVVVNINTLWDSQVKTSNGGMTR